MSKQDVAAMQSASFERWGLYIYSAWRHPDGRLVGPCGLGSDRWVPLTGTHAR